MYLCYDVLELSTARITVPNPTQIMDHQVTSRSIPSNLAVPKRGKWPSVQYPLSSSHAMGLPRSAPPENEDSKNSWKKSNILGRFNKDPDHGKLDISLLI